MGVGWFMESVSVPLYVSMGVSWFINHCELKCILNQLQLGLQNTLNISRTITTLIVICDNIRSVHC